MASNSASSFDLNNVPVHALKQKTRGKLCCMLNGTKVLPSPSGLPRDWRGIAHLTGIHTLSISFMGVNPMEKILLIWEKDTNATIGRLRQFLEEIDRYDAYDDTEQLMMDDAQHFYQIEQQTFTNTSLTNVDNETHLLTVDDVCRQRNGLLPQTYDAFVLFVDSDMEFATKLINTLEMDYGLKLCVKDRDLIGGLTFEHEAIMRLISERCNRLIVILSSEFLKSDAHKFFVNFAQAVGIERRSRKVVPCLYKKCVLPIELSSYFLLDYTRSNVLWNFWDRLRDSIVVSVPSICVEEQHRATLMGLPAPPNRCVTDLPPEEEITTKQLHALHQSSNPNIGSSNATEKNKSVSSLISKLSRLKPITQIFKLNKKKIKTPKLNTL